MTATDMPPTDPPPTDLPPTGEPERRPFLRWITYVIGALAAALGGLPILAYFIRTKQSPIQWVDLGAVGSFPINETRLVTFENPIRVPWDGDVAQTGVYVRNRGAATDGVASEDQFLILAMNCAHLGCGVEWFPESGLFLCPCHGGVYYENGEHASGPPPRGLFQCVWRITDGNVQIQAPHFPTLQDTLKDAHGREDVV